MPVFGLFEVLENGGVIFGDGIENDRIEFGWGRRVTISVSDIRFRLLRLLRLAAGAGKCAAGVNSFLMT